MKTLSFLILILSFGLNSFAQNYWEELYIPDSIKIYSLMVDNQDGIYLGTSIANNYGGVYYSEDNGGSWAYKNLMNKSIYALELNSLNHVLAGTSNGIYKSPNQGDSWDKVNAAFILTLASGFDSIVLAGSGYETAILRSADHGETWDVVLSFSNASEESVQDFTFAPNGKIYAGTKNPEDTGSGLYVSSNLGLSWELIAMEGINILTTLYSENHLFIGTFAEGLYKYRLSDNEVYQLIDTLSIRSLIIDSASLIYLGCYFQPFFNGGIIRFNDLMSSYEHLNSGLVFESSYGLDIDSFGHIFTFSSAWSHLYKSCFIVNVEKIQKKENLEIRIFPNPCQDNISLFPYVSSHESKYEVNFYNCSGQLVKSKSLMGGNRLVINISDLIQAMKLFKVFVIKSQ